MISAFSRFGAAESRDDTECMHVDRSWGKAIRESCLAYRHNHEAYAGDEDVFVLLQRADVKKL